MKKTLIVLVSIILIVIIACLIVKAINSSSNQVNNSNNEIVTTNIELSGEESSSDDGEKKEKKFDFTDELRNVFNNGALLAVADIREDTKEEFINKYFSIPVQYSALNRYNFSSNTDYQDTLVIIPNDESIKYDICSCKINEDGTVYADYVVFDSISEPIIFTFDDFESITPQNCIRIEMDGTEYLIPIVYSGMDGHLALDSTRGIVADISVYKD